jgi:hypothetical protein
MRHLRRLLDKYDSIGHAIMAYNAGEGALERHGGLVTYPETQQYTYRVLLSYLRKKGVPSDSAAARTLVGMEITPAIAGPSVRPGIGRTARPRRGRRGEGLRHNASPHDAADLSFIPRTLTPRQGDRYARPRPTSDHPDNAPGKPGAPRRRRQPMKRRGREVLRGRAGGDRRESRQKTGGRTEAFSRIIRASPS